MWKIHYQAHELPSRVPRWFTCSQTVTHPATRLGVEPHDLLIISAILPSFGCCRYTCITWSQPVTKHLFYDRFWLWRSSSLPLSTRSTERLLTLTIGPTSLLASPSAFPSLCTWYVAHPNQTKIHVHYYNNCNNSNFCCRICMLISFFGFILI